MKEKIEKLEKALNNPKITPEIKATLEKALAKLKAESQPKRLATDLKMKDVKIEILPIRNLGKEEEDQQLKQVKHKFNKNDQVYYREDPYVVYATDEIDGKPVYSIRTPDYKSNQYDIAESKLTLKEKYKAKPAAEPAPEPKPKKEKPEKQAPAVKKATDQERDQQYKAAVAELIKTIESGKSLSIAEVVKYGKDIQALRSKHSQGDTKADNKNRLSPTKENLLRWINNPGGFDLIGVDTSSKNDATADLKHVRKETVFNLVGKIKADQ